MATQTTYTYSISQNFPNKLVNSDTLTIQIQKSTISVALLSISTIDNTCNITFKDVLSSTDQATLNEIVATHTGVATSALNIDSNGRLLVVPTKMSEMRKTIVTHDFTDPTTWYQTAKYITNETAANSGNNQQYTLANKYVIDTYHGLITREDYLLDADGYSYRVEVFVNDVQKLEQDPFYGTGGDYTVDYKDGYVNFISPLQPTDMVTVNYHAMVNSLFVIKPSPGKQLTIYNCEIQFGTDCVLLDSCVFCPYGLVDVFSPSSIPTIPSGTLIPLDTPTVYKAFSDFQNDATKAYPVYPAIGGNNWRAQTEPIMVMCWDYVSSIPLRSDYGMEIKLQLQHDTPFQGWYATATFYCVEENIP